MFLSVPIVLAQNEGGDSRKWLYPYYDDAAATSCNPSTGGSTSQLATGFDPMGLGFPAFPDEAALGPAITNFIKTKEPSSPWLTMSGVEENVGTWIVDQSKSRSINPMFIVTAGKVENQFGTTGDAPALNNFFGMKGGNDTYLRFDTPQLGIQAFMDKIKQNTQSGEGRYAEAKNLYEYMSIHQAGSIVYPGQDFDPRDVDEKPGITKDLWDPAMDVWLSWDPDKNKDNPRADRRGQYTPLIYYRISVGVINEILGLNIPEDNPQGANGASCGGNGAVNVNGYAFPLEPQTKAVGGVGVGWSGLTRPGGGYVHHDKTAAFDLFSTDSADVYTIYGGTAVTVNTNYHDQVGCTTIQLKADDGFYYWYGHMKNPTITEGQHVAVGTKIAEIADRANFNGECWGGAPHLHIDRGCTISGEPQTGGRDECRDVNFIEFLSKLYETLPG
ncbi:MAG: M23 family metallopeptidase [Patescibacteria group bacterium]